MIYQNEVGNDMLLVRTGHKLMVDFKPDTWAPLQYFGLYLCLLDLINHALATSVWF